MYDVMGAEAEVPVGDGRMRYINDGVAGRAMLIASRSRLNSVEKKRRDEPRALRERHDVRTRFLPGGFGCARSRGLGRVCIRRVSVVVVVSGVSMEDLSSATYDVDLIKLFTQCLESVRLW